MKEGDGGRASSNGDGDSNRAFIVDGSRGEEGNVASSCGVVVEAGDGKSDEAGLEACGGDHVSSKEQGVGKDCDEIGDRRF